MKKLLFLIALPVFCFSGLFSKAQAPQKISYQAVVRNNNGDILPNTEVGIRIGILQNVPTGTAIYQEVYNPNPQTNSFGIVMLSIGSGIPQIGAFSSVNWAGGVYYIRIEIDPAGGANYTLTSTSQFLSVPYSFYSSSTGAAVPAHFIGEFYAGGIVFYVDHTGNHGLVCSVVELSAATTWSDYPTTLIGPAAQSGWDGQGNSDAMLLQSASNSAADLCDVYTNTNYGTGVYNDWYLPAIDQLSLLYHALYQVNKSLDTDGNGVTLALTRDKYWSSTESSSISAWAFDFITGTIVGNDKLCTPIRVRAIRAF